jgi:molybdopterin molybdotransferase
MVSVGEAVDRILESVKAVDTESVDLVSGLSRILATDVSASMDLPPFSHTTVDGYAVHSQDAQQASKGKEIILRVVETIHAGSTAKRRIEPGLSIRVMTGAPLPTETHAVVKDEDTSPARGEGGLIRIDRPISPMENMAPAGGDVRRGEAVLGKGTTLRPEGIGVLASLGFQRVVVFKQPRVALLSTGSELVDLGQSLGAGNIFASSYYLLLAKLRDSGCTNLTLGIVPDDKKIIENRLETALDADATITVGGTGEGDSDWVRDIYRRMQIRPKVDRVAMSPGRSFVFGLLREKPVFSLPGSPTACLVAFEELIRPGLLKMRGITGYNNLVRPTLKMSLGERIRGKSGLRKYVLCRVAVRRGIPLVMPIGKKHGGALSPLAHANGLMVLPENASEMLVGEEVVVRLLDTNLMSEESSDPSTAQRGFQK